MALLQTALYVAAGFAAGFFYKQYQAENKNPLDHFLPPKPASSSQEKPKKEKVVEAVADAPEAEAQDAVEVEQSKDEPETALTEEEVFQTEPEETVSEDVIDVGETAEAVVWDDLTKVKGIGPVFAERFYEAGIKNFADLAALTPENAREIADVQDWHQADPADWIAQAAELS